jgi:uncharacterized OB-fold protein
VYQDRTNATAIHAAARLDRSVPAYDLTGSVRSSVAALDAALAAASGTHLVVGSDLRTGRPGSADEAAGGDAAAALLVGAEDDDHPLLATLLRHTSVTEEFLDRWRAPGDPASRTWEERFGATRYTSLGLEAWNNLLAGAAIDASQIDLLVVCGTHDRAVTSVVKKTGVAPDRILDRLGTSVGNTGAAQPALLLAAALEQAAPGQTVALLVLADGADAFLWQTADALADYRPARPVAEQVATGGAVAYGRYLAWRGFLPVEPPRRPEPARTSASAAARSTDWKFGLVGSGRGGGAGRVHLPPSAFDDAPHPASEARGTIVTFTVDRLAYSPSPPVVFAIVDFDGGGRLPIELTDVDPGEVAIGGRVEAAFRRLNTADGVHNYFWKARPVRSRQEAGQQDADAEEGH